MLAFFHTYLFYPFLLWRWSKGKKTNEVVYSDSEEWPRIFVLMSLYNEEKVITQKLDSLLQQNYDPYKFFVFIGSDCSSDQTDAIVSKYAAAHIQVVFFPFEVRRGKPGVINELSCRIERSFQPTSRDIYLITDANVILEKNVFKKLAQHFKEESIGLVDARMIHTGMKDDGISKAEDRYISAEVRLKHWESLIWRKMIGPFGGCYAVRASHFRRIPGNFLVDDFYIAMKVFEQGANAINEMDAHCFEAVSHELAVEYSRKRRISAGNYQNLLTFPHLWWPPFKPLSFAFFSHKVLRWWGPFFLILIIVSSLVLAASGTFFFQLFSATLVFVLVCIPLIDWILAQFNINIKVFRGLRYFILMNMALLEGFIKFLNGIQTNVWQPTKRT